MAASHIQTLQIFSGSKVVYILDVILKYNEIDVSHK